MRHTLSIVVDDQPGELSRIVGLFSARGFNIETISVGATLDPQWARVTIVTRGDERTIDQIVKQQRGCLTRLYRRAGGQVLTGASPDRSKRQTDHH